jgi:hypothetical protein
MNTGWGAMAGPRCSTTAPPPLPHFGAPPLPPHILRSCNRAIARNKVQHQHRSNFGPNLDTNAPFQLLYSTDFSSKVFAATVLKPCTHLPSADQLKSKLLFNQQLPEIELFLKIKNRLIFACLTKCFDSLSLCHVKLTLLKLSNS